MYLYERTDEGNVDLIDEPLLIEVLIPIDATGAASSAEVFRAERRGY